MHLPGLAMLPCGARVRELLASCALLACEVDLDAARGQAAAWMPSGWSLRAVLPPARYEKVRRMWLRAFQVDIAQFDQVPPLALIAMVSRRVLAMRGPALDEELWALAPKLGLRAVGLETAEEQVAALFQVPLEQQLRELVRIARNPAAFRRHLRKRRELYLEGHMQLLYRLVRKESGRARKLLIDARNERMAARAWPLIQQQAVFMAVGAAHLAGHKGLLRLFKHRGLRPVPLPWHAC